MAKIERKYLAHYINASTDGEAAYVRLGRDLEEYSPSWPQTWRRRATSWARPRSW